ncbi:MAG: hypothetical protein ACLFQ8_00275 [Candidatus Aenigmatarchaeota archaeon]
MFLRFEETKCPLCGTSGKDSDIEELSDCPKCGAKFNEFGVVHAPQTERNIHWT